MKEHDTVPDEIVQRFIDQELSADERLHFVVALGRDGSLRDRVVMLERLVLEAGRLPAPAVPEGFVAGVLRRIDASGSAAPGSLSVAAAPGSEAPSSDSFWQRVSHALWKPRQLRWNLAAAAVAAAVIAIAAGTLITRQTTGSSAPAAAAPPTVLVRLVIMEPGARTVQAAGDFNGWNPARTPLEQLATGAWAVTLPLEPGRYEYMFVVDGERWVADPFAVDESDDGFGARNAVLDVRPPSVESL